MRKILVFILLFLLVVGLVGCSQSISDVRSQEYIGKKVIVTGTAEKVVKFGKLSGYTVKDDTGEIGVSAKNLPEEGEKVTVKGVLMKDSLVGYYILVS